MKTHDCGCKTDGEFIYHTLDCKERRRKGLSPPKSDLEGYHLPNRRPYPRMLRPLLRWLQRRCQHRALKADILEGSAYPHAVRWCETCGAFCSRSREPLAADGRDLLNHGGSNDRPLRRLDVKIAFDVGGVISAAPAEFTALIRSLDMDGHEIYIVSDMHPVAEIIKVLGDNHLIGLLDPARCHSADYQKHGNAAKAVLLRDLGIDMLFDDFLGYLVWPWETPAPIRFLVMPDPRRPYWHPDWKSYGSEFGRRCYMDERKDREQD